MLPGVFLESESRLESVRQTLVASVDGMLLRRNAEEGERERERERERKRC